MNLEDIRITICRTCIIFIKSISFDSKFPKSEARSKVLIAIKSLCWLIARKKLMLGQIEKNCIFIALSFRNLRRRPVNFGESSNAITFLNL
jgi:hypothetical protein